jgi:Carboxypeptidase regulatory-like domain/TonB dependent receptor
MCPSKNRLRCTALLALVFALGPGAILGWAQTFRGGINGAVTDPDGAAIPNAAVTVTSDDTGISHSGLSSTAGEFDFPDLPVGRYTLQVGNKGFDTAKIENVTVSAGSFFTVPVKLRLAGASEGIVVSTADLSLDTTSVTQTTDIPTTVVNQTPNNGRDFTQFIQFTPGFAGYSINGGDVASSINGARSNQINWQIEGTDNNDLWWNVPAVNQGGVALISGTLLPLDAIEQFSFVTSGAPETGRNSGGTVNLSFKAGTNAFHGSAYYFNHNEFFAVETPFAPAGTRKNKIRNINDGFSLGGPIWRNRSFFFVAFEHQNFVIGNQATSTEPSTAYQTAAASLLAYYGMPTNSVSTALLQNLWPQSALTGPATANNYFNPDTENGHSYNGLIKLDHTLGTHNHLSVKWFAGQGDQTAPTFSDLSPYYEVAPIHVQNYSVVYNRTFSAKLVNQIYAGVSYFNQVFADADHGYNPVALGLNTGVIDPDLLGAPQITIGPSSVSAGPGLNSSGFDPIGVTSPSGRNDITGHIDEALSYNVGTHQFRFGGEFRKAQVDDFYQTGARGAFRFDGSQGPWYSPTGGSRACTSLANKNVGRAPPGYGSGDSYDGNVLFLADFLAGCVSTSSIVLGDQRRQVFMNSFDLFGQDAWQLTAKLNLNYGLRYDFVDAIHNPYRNLTSFDPDAVAGFAIQGQNAANLYVPYKGAISPRVGAAYALGSNLVLRGGFGIYFNVPYLEPLLDLSGTTNGGALGVGNNPAGNEPVASAAVNNYVIVDDRPIFPSLSSAISGAGVTNVYSVHANFRPSSTYSYNVNLQQRFGRAAIAQIGYFGTQSRHLPGVQDINQAALNSANLTAATYPSSYPSCNTAKYSYQQCTRPYFSAYPEFGVINQLKSNLNSNYNGLQAVLRISSWRDLILQTTYTWSHALDYATGIVPYLPQNSFDLAAEYGNSDFDTRNSVSAYFVYQVPSYDTGPKLLTHGWEVSGAVNLHGGQPFSVIAATNASGNGEFADRANLVPGVNPFAGVSHKIQNGAVVWFNAAAFVDPPPGTYGTQRRNQFHNPGFADTDLSVLKTIDITETSKVEFRAEMFNVFNRINLAPVGFPQVDSRGTIGSTIGTFFGAPGIGPGEPFNVRFALKAIF